MKYILWIMAAWLTVVGAAALSLPRQDVSAQTGPTVVSANVTNRFPEGLRFQLEAQSSGEVTEVELRYAIQPDGVTNRVLARCTPEKGPRVSCSAEVAPNNPPIPPFAVLRYSWRAVDGSGGVTEGEESSVIYEDIRFQWRQAILGNLTVYTYGNVNGQQFAAAGRTSLDKTERLLRAPVQFPVRVVVYNSVGDMRAAMSRRSETYNEQIVTQGQRISADAVLVLNARDAISTLQHELAHVVTKQAGEMISFSMPAWLDEGTAVNAQDGDREQYESAVRAAAAKDQLLSWRSISSPAGNPQNVTLFYGESYYAVRFLIDTYGEEKFAQLFAVFKRGARVDDAMKEVYGKDLVALENEWRATLGLPPRTGGEARNEARTEGTLTPFGAAGGGVATPAPEGRGDSGVSDDRGDGGESNSAIILIAAFAVAIAVLAIAGSVVLARRR